MRPKIRTRAATEKTGSESESEIMKREISDQGETLGIRIEIDVIEIEKEIGLGNIGEGILIVRNDIPKNRKRGIGIEK
jgi:hypothetical protein